MGTTVTAKADVIRWLKRSPEAVKEAHAAERPADLQRQTKFFNTTRQWTASSCESSFIATSIWGKLVAYARMTGVVAPRSK